MSHQFESGIANLDQGSGNGCSSKLLWSTGKFWLFCSSPLDPSSVSIAAKTPVKWKHLAQAQVKSSGEMSLLDGHQGGGKDSKVRQCELQQDKRKRAPMPEERQSNCEKGWWWWGMWKEWKLMHKCLRHWERKGKERIKTQSMKGQDKGEDQQRRRRKGDPAKDKEWKSQKRKRRHPRGARGRPAGGRGPVPLDRRQSQSTQDDEWSADPEGTDHPGSREHWGLRIQQWWRAGTVDSGRLPLSTTHPSEVS